MPSPQDKWEQYAEPAGTDKWERFAEQSEASQVASRPSQKAAFSIPVNSSNAPRGSSLAMIGEGEEVGAEGRRRMAEEHPGMLASAALAGATPIIPTTGMVGAAANIAGRGMSALTGASAGGKLASSAGLPRWTGQVAGGVTGLLAPEVAGKMLSKMSGPIISKIATLLGKSAPEVATIVAEDSTLAQRVGRDVAERAARGEPLTEKEEQLLLEQVQKHYTPETGIESAASKSGKVYAARGTSMRPTNEQIELARKTGKLAPPPSPASEEEGIVEFVDPDKQITRNNASGQTTASVEAEKRMAAEKAKGVKYYVMRGERRVREWIGNDPGVARLNPGENIRRVNHTTGEEINY